LLPPPLGGGLGGISVIITSEIELSRITLVTSGLLYDFFNDILLYVVFKCKEMIHNLQKYILIYNAQIYFKSITALRFYGSYIYALMPYLITTFPDVPVPPSPLVKLSLPPPPAPPPIEPPLAPLK
jgi:hypothetical protein